MLAQDQTIPLSMAHAVVLYGKVMSNTAALATARPTASAIAADTADVAGTAAIVVVVAAADANAAVSASVTPLLLQLLLLSFGNRASFYFRQ